MNDKVTATLVANEDRLKFLPATFGTHYLRLEAEVYNWMERVCDEYHGGYWEFYTLSNGAGYMRWVTEQMELQVIMETNGYSGKMSPDAASLVACAMAINHTLWNFRTEELSVLWEHIMEYIYRHPEWERIGAALD